MESVFSFITRVLGAVCAVLFAVLVLTTTWQVFSRLILNSPVTWSEELAKMVFVWLSFLGLGYVYGERGHMAVEFLARRFSPAKERVFALWTHAVAFAFAVVVLVWGGVRASANAWSQNLTALPVSIGAVYLVLPISGVAIAIYAVYHFLEIAAGRESNYPVPESEAAVADAAVEAARAQKGAHK